MLMSTTFTVEGQPADRYLGVVTGVIGIDLDYEILRREGLMLMVTDSGTTGKLVGVFLPASH